MTWYLGTMNGALFIINGVPSHAPDDTGRPWDNPSGPKAISAAIDDKNVKLIVEAHNTSITALEAENKAMRDWLTDRSKDPWTWGNMARKEVLDFLAGRAALTPTRPSGDETNA